MNNEIIQPTRDGAIDKTSGFPGGFPDHAFEHNGTEDNASPVLTLKSPWTLEVEEPLVFSDDNNMGTLHMIPEGSRPATWVLNGGTDASFTDVDFGAYVPTGVTGLLLEGLVRFVGTGAADAGIVVLRENGSVVTDEDKLVNLRMYRQDMTNGLFVGPESQFSISCDSDGVVEYRVTTINTSLWLNILGYYI